MDDKEKEREVAMAWRAKAFPPIDFSNIPYFSRNAYDVDIYDFILDFHGGDQLTIHHITTFIQVMVDFNIAHEEDWLQFLLLLLLILLMIGFMTIFPLIALPPYSIFSTSFLDDGLMITLIILEELFISPLPA